MNALSNTISRFRRFDHGGSISGTVAVNFTSAALSALTSVVFARILGISHYGLYVYVISATGFMGSIAKLGLPTLITRQVAAWSTSGDWPHFNGIIRFGILATLASSTLFGLILLACNSFLGRISASPGFFVALALGIGIMVLQCIDSTVAGALQGMHYIARSLIPQAIALPSCLLVFIIAAHILHTQPTAIMLLATQLGLGIMMEAYQLFSLRRRLPAPSIGAGYTTTARAWLRSSLPFWGNGILFIINIQADTLMIGYFKGGSSAAVYAVGTKGAQLVVLTLGAVVTAIQPRLAGLHNAGNHEE
nr:oligosaccharide flippase family protein [Acidobacteriota bacterium]